MELHDLPLFHAALNAIATVLLLVGWLLIRPRGPGGQRSRRHWKAHRAVMISALAVSTTFLISYLYYHAHVGSVPFEGQGLVRRLYFSILLTHMILAASVPALAAITATRGFRRRYPQHVAIARWTLPIWLYVSITGVVIYWMLYRLAP